MHSNRPVPANARPTLCPKLRFYKDTDPATLRIHLQAYRVWLSRPEISQPKNIILMNIVSYLDNITNKKLSGFITDKSRFIICSNILSLGDYPDILLMKYIIDQLKNIPDPKSSLRDPNLKCATNMMELLLKPYLRETKKIGAGLIALAFSGVVMKLPTEICLLICCIGILAIACGQPFTEYRVATALQDRLDAQRARALGVDINHAQRLEDEFEPVADVLNDVASTGMRLFMGFFHQQRARLTSLAENVVATNATPYRVP
jgi:hypothetical protein